MLGLEKFNPVAEIRNVLVQKQAPFWRVNYVFRDSVHKDVARVQAWSRAEAHTAMLSMPLPFMGRRGSKHRCNRYSFRGSLRLGTKIQTA